MQPNIWQKLQSIDSRVIYTILILVILFPLFDSKLHYINIPSRQSIEFYQTVEKLRTEQEAAHPPVNKLVIVDGQWSPSTRGENQWQTVAILTHLMRSHLHFAILSFDAQNNGIMQEIVTPLAAKYHYVYGVDYVNWGYRPLASFPQTLKGIVNKVPGTIKTDYALTPLTDTKKLPVMQGIRDIKDISAIVEITPTDSIDAWLGLVQGVNNTPLLYATTAIGAPKYYPYLDSGQIAGMMTGVKGAGDYESMLNAPTFGTRATGALSFVYALIIGLIILGNVGYYAGRAKERKGQTA